ncbi:sensor histidine kinase [Streptomyces sp. NPDC050504]|uniref:sensor histidine kinase n=1 Tax=Streptomyces sp. NPDC050504 TaxID=3365618 RepID=UPI00379083FD
MTSQSSTARGSWAAWPSKEALSQLGVPLLRRAVDVAMWLAMTVWMLWEAYDAGVFRGALLAVPLAGGGLVLGGVHAFRRFTHEQRLTVSLAVVAALVAGGGCSYAAGAREPAFIIWIVCIVQCMERLPLVAAVPTAAVVLTIQALGSGASLVEMLFLGGGVVLAGSSLRLDAQARAAGFRLLAQERAARDAQAQSAALAERARIAREIHDVLAHSLSAQLVHLEAARIQIERGADREQVLERVVAARGMAREGLAETRQALSALRGDMTPVEEFLREVSAADGASVEVAGERRTLPAEASQAVRRVAQEALTNVRKHAPGAGVRILLAYQPAQVELEVRDWGGKGPVGELAVSGSGYGLLGMRERAELLGGSLEAGPEGEGFMVRLRVPT